MNAPFQPMLSWRDVFLKLRSKIERALKIGNDTYDFVSLAVALENGRFKTFYAPDAILLVELVDYPRYRTCTFFLAAGHLPSVFMLEDRASEWAQEQGCKYVTLHGRKGWLRALKARGWKESKNISMYRELRP